MSYKERFLKILQANDLFSYRCVSLSQINMQQKLEELCQIETVLLLETVNVANLSQEHQVCSRVLQKCSFDTVFIEIIYIPLGKRKNLILKNILQDVQEKSLEVVKKTLVEDDKEKMSAEEYVKQKRAWETEMERVRAQLHNSQMVRVIIVLVYKS